MLRSMNAGCRAPHTLLVAAAICLAAAAAEAAADTITVDGVLHEGVYIRQTDQLVYIHFPEDGRVQAVPRGDLAEDSVHLLGDEAARAALLAQWEQRRASMRLTAASAEGARTAQGRLGQTRQPAGPRVPSTPTPAAQPATPTPQDRRDGVRSGIVDRVDLRDVPLRTALTAMLRPMGLDYAVRDGVVFMSTPEVLRTEPWEPLEVRVYDIKNFDATLPKIVVRNPAGARSGPIR